jgi:hypothetical protein
MEFEFSKFGAAALHIYNGGYNKGQDYGERSVIQFV